MHFSNEFTAQIRKLDMEIHCLSVCIWQDKKNGLELKGHGTIKQNKFGTLYLDFVCTETKYTLQHPSELVVKFPSDNLDLEEELYAELNDISGRNWKTRGFKLKLSVFNLQENKMICIPLSYIESEQERREGIDKNLMHLEFEQELDLPFNTSNTTTSSATGSQSHGMNELNFKTDNLKVRIVNDSNYRFVKVIGDFEPEGLEQCLKFYLGFSCGILLQPYIIFRNVGTVSKCLIRSFNNQLSHKRSSNPIPSNFSDPSGIGTYSINLFYAILRLQKNYYSHFNCLNNQWERVWHAFNSTDSIAELVLSVAIEGVLNDIYIPDFKESRVDDELIETIEIIKTQLEKLDLSKDHIGRLKNSISHWKKTTAAKSLDILIEEYILANTDKKVWNEVRNASAHPRSKDLNSLEEQKKRDSVLACLDIFHKLVLNVLGYSGPVNVFGPGSQQAVMLEHKKVLSVVD